MATIDPPQRGLLPALSWACYLGSSWTWVIGMFFPILLLRDFGLWGWIVFAIPNVIGAAAMGFVLTRESSRAAVQRHPGACFAFSIVTLAFHFAVIGWIVPDVGGAGVLALLPLLILFKTSPGSLPRVAVAVTAISLVCFLIAQMLPGVWDHAGRSIAEARLTSTDLLLFAPASMAGFLLCPYLDLTFHHARQSTEAATGRVAFGVGFGGVFLAMILFSLAYAGVLGAATLAGLSMATSWRVVLAVHILLQASFTVAVHADRMRPLFGDGLSSGIVRVSILAALLPVVVGFVPLGTLSRFEVTYRTFLLFYGLVFPAYVWLCMIPSPWRDVSRSRTRLVFGAATVIALPMGFAGFVMGLSWWIPASLGVLVVARGVLELTGAPRSHQEVPR